MAYEEQRKRGQLQKTVFPHFPHFPFLYRKNAIFRGLCSNRISNATGRRIANNIFSLSHELGLPRLLRPGTERIKLYSQCNQLCKAKGIIEKVECGREKDSLVYKSPNCHRNLDSIYFSCLWYIDRYIFVISIPLSSSTCS